jgi:aminoglycoside phosphotransferase (APT) family kinase protein
LSELEHSRANRRVRVNWADAKEALYVLLEGEDAPINRDSIGSIRHIGEGLSNRVFGTSIKRASGQEEWVVVKLPCMGAGPERDDDLRREAAVLRYLEQQSLTFKVPRPIAELESSTGVAIVQEWIDGMSVNLKGPACFGEASWDLIARVAAAIHDLDPAPLIGRIPTHETRRDHALAFATLVDGIDAIEARETLAWINAHLPTVESPTLVHGDLLGQNLKLPIESDVVGVIDWAAARIGDPAYDIAIITRCARKPFGIPDGRERLLDAYNRRVRNPITLFDVHLYELVLAAHWYQDACDTQRAGSGHAANQLAMWRSLLKRAPTETGA